ncbi:MAG: tRNA (adenosine(37)-N6)-threonylcarbamoyltransferase complex transferase subunit TsaD [Actinobacteria bacterium]|nr:tRNA (adenosine(37)-N6)-threonylcarbamoyltransferase complex transferase subunit TsaD [Actinomycetota bacterium]
MRPRESVVNILGIETSCDETAVGIVTDGRDVACSVIASQVDLHARFGGVVPELASRAHTELVNVVLAQALVEAGMDLSALSAVAACAGPGLAGALLVGVAAAKSLALVLDVPYVAVNHMEGHLYAAFLEEPELAPPMVVLLVSGGHTMIVHMTDHGRYRILGETVDDAAGEAFDKVARLLGLGYPGGPAIDSLGARGNAEAVRFPRPMLDEGYDFSFSGLKTAVLVHWTQEGAAAEADVAASFQEAAVDVLVTKLFRAAEEFAAPTVVIGGGVAANSRLRERVLDEAERRGLRAVVPSAAMCTDNGAMIAAAAFRVLEREGPSSLGSGATPGLRLAGRPR